jgi:predicted esterase
VEVRAAVLEYLNEPSAHARVPLLDSVRSHEGASVKNVAALLAHMRPPWDLPADADRKFGAFALTAPGHTEHGDFRYLVQLPPEYDPYRNYPTLVALNGAYNTPLEELNFWAGAQRVDEQGQVIAARNAQAMRHGYIVVAVDWQKPQQYDYEYSLRELEAVLTCLRDACRRFSIDTDRVFLSGHGMGGDAAWDFALAHPDLWAGAIPFVARSRKYVPYYWENAEHVPLYFVAGELDGKKMTANADVLNNYLRKRFDTTVVEYLGRGHEPFHDEIQRLFDWMGRRSRGPVPEEFACSTMRPWDNFFWWIEGREFPNPVYPQNWPRSGARATEVEGKRLNNNTLAARSASKQTTLWLSPDVVSFDEPIRVTLNGRRVSNPRGQIDPSLEVLLEDARTRADFLRPFWAKIEVP